MKDVVYVGLWLVTLYFSMTYLGVVGFYLWALVITLLGIDDLRPRKE